MTTRISNHAFYNGFATTPAPRAYDITEDCKKRIDKGRVILEIGIIDGQRSARVKSHTLHGVTAP